MQQDDRPIAPFVSELLCYAQHKFGSLPAKQLKTVIRNFYSPESIGKAKEKLVELLDELHVEHSIRTRRLTVGNADESNLKNLDEIYTMLNIIDEKNLYSQIPQFVAANPDQLPSVNWTEGDLATLLEKISDMDKRIALINENTLLNAKKEATLLNTINEHSNILATIKNQFATGRRTDSPSRPPFIQRSASFRNFADNATHSSAALTDGTLPLVPGNKPSSVGLLPPNVWSSLPVSPSVENNQLNFTEVISRKRQRELSEAQLRLSNANDRENSLARPSAVNSGRSARIIGTAATTAHLKGGKDLTRKLVFCVNNVDADVTCDELTEFVKSINVRIISCFEAKTRFSGSKAFRVCINYDDHALFLDSANWPCNIVLRDWAFKRTERTERTGDTGVGVGSENGSSNPKSASMNVDMLHQASPPHAESSSAHEPPHGPIPSAYGANGNLNKPCNG
jgi:hypothetical protein